MLSLLSYAMRVDNSASTHNIDEERRDHAANSPGTRSHSESQVSATVLTQMLAHVSTLCSRTAALLSNQLYHCHETCRVKAVGFQTSLLAICPMAIHVTGPKPKK